VLRHQLSAAAAQRNGRCPGVSILKFVIRTGVT
jgi:hypothetical protein